MERENVLATAGELITKDRADLYGPPEKSFGRIGALWGAMLGMEAIAPEMVALMLVQLKVSRIVSSPSHEDSWVDLCGYGALGGELATAPRSMPAGVPMPLQVGDRVRVLPASGHGECVNLGVGRIEEVVDDGSPVLYKAAWTVDGEYSAHTGNRSHFEFVGGA
ncbi:hypothetical protein HUN58_14515 [Curtobacterium sp. Csp1]|uniref:DUF6378 domain-containing protein n=1 Tax=unclassified Curtobacterium TaxID=257496 RepID=UPI0015995EED|nr:MULTISPECIES: DUF6378 domain-containing protein [unclassified Curtobacterium]QKS13924.1 hypothetical protein HUN60_12950 [Curtobacterium sp. csp3]QKS20967.1 hypothetical protein HUN58_14515 [Curtobacterium sp. Csp1]